MEGVELSWAANKIKYTYKKYAYQKYTLEKYMYIFLKSIAAIIHFQASVPDTSDVFLSLKEMKPILGQIDPVR